MFVEVMNEIPKKKKQSYKERERDSHYLRVKGWKSHVEYQNNFKLNGRKDKETISTSQGAHNLPLKGGEAHIHDLPYLYDLLIPFLKLILMS